jgi:hypothetical protein
MIRLLWKTLCIVIVIVVVNLLLLFYFPRGKVQYVAGALDKHERLDSLIGTPKMIIVGGSGAAFSIDSTQLEEAFGLPTVNMGITAALGMDFMLSEVRPYIEAGDVILIVLEYDHYHEENPTRKELADLVLLDPARFLPMLTTYEQAVIVAQYYPRSLREWMSFYWRNGGVDWCRDPEQTYCRTSFDERGDVIIHLDRDGMIDRIEPPSPDNDAPATPNVLSKLEHFIGYAHDQGATVILMPPAVPHPAEEPDETFQHALFASLRSELDISIVGDPADFIYDYDQFFDGRYHLTGPARSIRTGRMVEMLTPILLP